MNVWTKWGVISVLYLVAMAIATVMLGGFTAITRVVDGAASGSALLLLLVILAVIVVGVIWLLNHEAPDSGREWLIICLAAMVAVCLFGWLAISLAGSVTLALFRPILLLAIAIAAGYGTLRVSDR